MDTAQPEPAPVPHFPAATGHKATIYRDGAMRVGTTSAPVTTLAGREREMAALGELLSDVSVGRSRALVVSGAPGIGKTALLEEALESTPSVQVIRISGVESEAELAYGALHGVWSHLPAESLSALPEPQRVAACTAFGLEVGPAPNPFLVGLAMLNGLADLAEQTPHFLVVDDAQWLDRASASALAFVARRLQFEPIGVVFAVREPMAELSGLPELHVSGLAPDAARRVLASVLSASVDGPVVERFIAETEGNPLALLELSHGLSATAIEGDVDRRDSRGLWLRLEESFQRRVEALEKSVRTFLLIAAAEPAGDPVPIWRAAGLLGLPDSVGDAAEESGLIRRGTSMVFRHPLVRSAIYRFASLADRRAVHRALAEATDPDLDPDRRAWHRALAAPGLDEQVALELEQSAGRARARGGFAAAAAFLERALALTADSDRRASRALASAQAKLAAGDPGRASDLLAIAERGRLDELSSAQLDLLRARLAFAVNRRPEAPGLLLKAARQFERLDREAARDIYLEATRAALFAGRLASGGGLAEVATEVRELALPDPPCLRDLALHAFAIHFVDGFQAAAPEFRKLVAACQSQDFSPPEQLHSLSLAVSITPLLWDYEAWEELAELQLRLVREMGALGLLPIALTTRAGAHHLAAEYTPARALLDELDAASEAMGTPTMPYARVAYSARVSPPEEAMSLIERCIEEATQRGEGGALTFVQGIKAELCNALGRYEEAWTAAAIAYEDPLQHSTWWLAELVEGAARSGRAEQAAPALEDLAVAAAATGSPWAHASERRSRALVSCGEQAESFYLDSIDYLKRTRLALELARSMLVYGEWLRREGRRRDAREQLRSAHAIFDQQGILAFRDRAANELAATGETIRRKPADATSDTLLTAREAQIARLAAEGLSNREIGEQLFISHRTAGYHLGHVFTKLGVSSRAQLHKVLPPRTRAL
jgi:DNA-binding CsgD family transcriptional regulator